jgi:hypothetical protein
VHEPVDRRVDARLQRIGLSNGDRHRRVVAVEHDELPARPHYAERLRERELGSGHVQSTVW